MFPLHMERHKIITLQVSSLLPRVLGGIGGVSRGDALVGDIRLFGPAQSSLEQLGIRSVDGRGLSPSGTWPSGDEHVLCVSCDAYGTTTLLGCI